MADVIRYERDTDGVVMLTIDLPGRPVNVLSEVTVRALIESVERVLTDPEAVGAVIASAKKDFVVGLDLNEVGPDRIGQLNEGIAAFHLLTRRMETGGKPFVAALTGTALGGGAELALACHRRIAASDVDARFGLPEVMVGLFPAGGGTQRLPRLGGIMATLQLMLEGKRLRFPDAHAAKLIDQLVPRADLDAACRKWVLENPKAKQPWDERNFRVPGGSPLDPKIAELFVGGAAMLRKRTWGNYPATRSILSCVYEGTLVDIDTGLKIEAEYFKKLIAGPEARAMVKTLFFSKNEADKLRARPPHVPPFAFKHVGVLGAGMMGAGIAYAAAKAGARVTLIDRDEASVARGREKAIGLGGKPDEAVASRVNATLSYNDLAGADLIIEAVFEDRGIKADVTGKAEAAAGPQVIFGSNTSTLPIAGLAQASARPERFIGIHFFSPVEKMPLVEIIRGANTGDEALAAALDFVRFIGKTPIVVHDRRGFFTSRVFQTYLMEGLALLSEGCPPALIENAGRMAGMAVGPLAVADEVSFGLIDHITTQTKRDLGDAYMPGPGEDVVRLFAHELGRKGKAAGAGLYEYPQGGKKFLWPGLAQHFPTKRGAFDVETVKERLLYVQVAEAMRALGEGVLDDPETGDVGSILGWGFPAFTGGVFSFVEYVGRDAFATRAAQFAAQYGSRFAVPSLQPALA